MLQRKKSVQDTLFSCAAIYVRISKADRRNGSITQSLSNQIRLLEEIAKKDPQLSGMTVRIFQDEGFSGTTADRPGFQKMLAGIYLGRIQAVLIKDFSRFSRNHLFLSEFREKTCPKYQVIFVSVGDGYDSREDNKAELGAGLRSIFYEYYSRDISHKVKQSLEARKQNGFYAAARAPFGYQICDDRRGLVTDEQEAKIVRQIFCHAAGGKNTAWIARWLNDRREKESKKTWQAAEVWRILNNPVYMGCHVWHKYENTYQNGFIREAVQREEWRIQPDAHPALVEEGLYQKAGEKRTRTSAAGKRGRRHCFHGITRCRECGKALCTHRRKKELLCCNFCPSEQRPQIRQDILWKICQEAFPKDFPMELEKENYYEKEFFLHLFVRQIMLDKNGQVWMIWKFTDF